MELKNGRLESRPHMKISETGKAGEMSEMDQIDQKD